MALITASLTTQPANRWSRVSLRTRMVVAFVGMVFLALLGFGLASALVSGTALTSVVGSELNARAEEEAALLAESLGQQVTSLRVLSLNQSIISAVKLANLQYPTSETSVRQRLAQLDAQWAVAPADSGLVRSRITDSQVAATLRDFRSLQPDNVELIIADAFGGLVAATERTTDYDQSNESWWQAAHAGSLYLSQPELDASTGLVTLNMAVPVLNPGEGSVIGVVRTSYSFDALASQLQAVQVGATGGATLRVSADRMLDERGQIATIDASTQESLDAAEAAPYAVRSLGGRERVISVANVGDTGVIRERGWRLVFYQDSAEALSPLLTARNAQLLAALVALVVAGGLAALLARRITAPLSRLAAAAQGVGEGDLGRRVGLHGEGEIGQLAQSFDSMADALQRRMRSEQEAQADRLRLQDEMIRVQRDTLKELATPLIPLNAEVLLLPLVGSVDRERAQQVFQALLQGVAARRARRVIIDLTGVPTVDAQVATTLLQAAQGVRLIGAEVALTGISASLARTLVELDLPLGEVEVLASLEEALGRAAVEPRRS